MTRAASTFRPSRRTVLRASGLAALGVGSASLLSACGSSGEPGGGELLTAPDVEKAKAEGVVNFYTSVDTKALEAMNAAFTAKYGIEVKYFRGDSQAAIARILDENRADSIQADVVETSDSTGIMYLKDQGITRVYESPDAAKIPAKYKDPENHWVYTRLTLAVITCNKKLPKMPTGWKDLTQEPFRDSLAYFSDSRGSGAARLWTIAENLGWELLEDWAAAGALRVETPQLLRQTVERGERLVGIAQNDNHALSSKLDTNGETDLVIAKEGVPLEPAAMAVIAKAPHPNAALLYYDFWLSEEGMNILASIGKKYVSREGIEAPAGALPLSEIPLMVPDYDKYIKERDEVLARMQTIFGGEWGL